MIAPRGRVVLSVGLAVGVVAVVAGTIVAGAPGRARSERLDGIRARDLRVIAMAVDRFAWSHERLPESLAELEGDPRSGVTIRDPATREDYEYRARGDAAYELCAIFEVASRPDNRARGSLWRHEAGRNCFPLTVSSRPEELRLPSRLP